MNEFDARFVSRRRFVGGGLLVLWFSLTACSSTPSSSPTAAPTTAPTAAPAATAMPAATAVGTPPATPAAPATAVRQEQLIQQPPPPTSETQATGAPDQLDSWLAIAPDSTVTIFSGKVELGTGVQTALGQIAADELDVPFNQVKLIMGVTGQTPDEGYTAGSKTLQVGGVNVRKAAAEARSVLLDLAAQRLTVPASQLTIKNGTVSGGGKSASYGDLVGGKRINATIPSNVQTKNPSSYTIVGTSVARVDLPDKVFGNYPYMQNLRVNGMLHGRIVRPPGVGATLESVDESTIQGLAGHPRVVRNGNFLGVVADTEWGAIQAAQKLKATWKIPGNLPAQSELFSYVRGQPTTDKVEVNHGDVAGALKGAAKTIGATYQQPYQAHASIGPSCSVADVKSDSATIWSGTQGVYPLRGALAQMLGLPVEKVEVAYLEAAGCYGHNGADDVSGDAALLSKAVGKPVRVQWMRQDEFAYEPKGPAMVMTVKGGLDSAGNIVGWLYEVWTPTHSTRPSNQAGNLIAGRLMSPPAPEAKNGAVGGDRNAPTVYNFANQRVVAHWLPLSSSFLRPSALRSLGGMANTFANESFMDELAYAAEIDPVQFRLRHLSDPRAIAVIQAAAKQANWQTAKPSPKKLGASGTSTGRGFSFVRYETNETYLACVADVQVRGDTGQAQVTNLTIAHDCGLIVNPDGLKNQIEGNAIQATSRALKEQVTWNANGVTSLDWRGYPILTFPEVPNVDVVLVDHPDKPAWGAGEPTTEVIPAAIANAIFAATGARVRTVPFTAERVKAELQV